MTTIKTGIVHRIPKDLKEVLVKNNNLLLLWNSLTPIARNEWICYITIVKKSETRKEHLMRLSEDLQKGKRRPCCWPGCPHRNTNTQKYFA